MNNVEAATAEVRATTTWLLMILLCMSASNIKTLQSKVEDELQTLTTELGQTNCLSNTTTLIPLYSMDLNMMHLILAVAIGLPAGFIF